MKQMAFLLFSALSLLRLSAQHHKLYGTIKSNTTEPLAGALIVVQELKGVGVATDPEGNFKLSLPPGSYTIKITLMSYKPLQKTIQLNADQSLDLTLEEESSELEEVVVVAQKNDRMSVAAGVERLDMKQINKIPVLMGERDVLKTLQLLPGVKGAGEGSSGFYVRGGSTDQNLVLLDDAPVFNANHLFGMFSTFNSDIIDDVTLYKSGMPANYGGRLSSVLDVATLEGDKQTHHASGNIGLISSRLKADGPIRKDRASYLVSVRRTYADLFLKLMPDEELRSKQLYFYDINARVSYTLNDKNRVFLSGYFGRDKLRLDSTLGMNWGNYAGTLRWNRIMGAKLLSNTSLVRSSYDYKISLKLSEAAVSLTSEIQSTAIKHEYKYFARKNHKLTLGVSATHYRFLPGQLGTTSEHLIKPTVLQKRYALENAVYFSNDWKIRNQVDLTYGIRFSAFNLIGSGDFSVFDNKGDLVERHFLPAGKRGKTYASLEPRVSASFALDRTNSLKGSYARNIQNIHLLSGSTSENPTDIWLPSSYNIRPEISVQYSLGYYKTLQNSAYELGLETYYKDLQNQIDYRNGASVLANENVEAELLYGMGRAYGLELVLKKKTGKITGWIGYTLSRTERKIEGINEGSWYAAKQDRTHDISVVGIYDINTKWSVAATWVYNTGNAVTFPTGKYSIDGKIHYAYSDRNGSRMPAYHRMDLAVTWIQKKTSKLESSWNVSLYNVYARENAYNITFQQDPHDASRTQAIQTTLFRIIPSINYNSKF